MFRVAKSHVRDHSSTSILDETLVDPPSIVRDSRLKSVDNTTEATPAVIGIPRVVNSVFPSRDIKREVRRLTINVWIGTCLAVLGVGLAMLENELCYKNDFKADPGTDVLRTMILLISLTHIYVIYRYYRYLTAIAKAFGEVSAGSNF
jgi:hypothetical protein